MLAEHRKISYVQKAYFQAGMGFWPQNQRKEVKARGYEENRGIRKIGKRRGKCMKKKQRHKKLFEKVLAFLLVLTMCAGMLPMQTLATEKDEAIVQNETAADWKMQNFGADTDLDIQEGWMTPDETGDGVLVDYGKIYQDIGGNVVVYDNAAPIYQDSTLEFDITVTGGQENKYQVAFFPRFQSGKNCDGFAVGEKAQLQHSYQVNGQEGWPGVDNNLGMSFEVDQTYHIKMVTVGNTMSVYVGDKLLTSFETRSEITEGKYGFRIWTQSEAKTVHIENIKWDEYISSELEKKEEIIKSDEWGKEDVEIPVSFGKDDALDTIKNGDQELTEGTDYTIDGNTITLKKEYIEKQADSFSLNILFAKGSEDSFKVTRLDTTVKEHIWTPEQGLDEWSQIAGNGTYTLEEDGLHIKGETKLMNTASPSVMNGEIEMTFDQLTDVNYMGFLFGAKEDGTWQGVMKDDDYVLTRWYYHNSDGNRTGFHGDGSFLLSRDGEADTKLKLRFQGQTLSMWLDDQFMYTGSVSQVKDTIGKMGLLTGSKCDIVVKKVVFRSVLPFMTETDDSGDKIIAKDGMNVTLADDFPRVKEYDLNGKKMDGAEFKYDYVTINSVDYPATAAITDESDDSITYTVEPEGCDVKFDVVFTVLENHVLDMRIKNIVEPKDELVYSIGLPNQPLISANSNQSGAKLDASGFTESMGSFHNSQLSDFHYNISENKISKTADGLATIPVITTDELSASMANNVLLNIQEFRFRAFDLEDGSVSAGFWNNEFMYRGLDGEKIFPIASEPEEEDLYCQIILTEDTNADGTMDWQDGANALKNLVGDRIPGGEDAARSFFEVGYNFVSEAQQPFIKVGDNLKRMSNLIDGFDQILILKGYANEGHDSGHADYDDINKRAGGVEDLNAMTEAIKDINATFGIHINHTEAYPEAEMYNDHVISTNNAWAWMDQSKNIRREVDILNTAEGQRTMDERLDSMFEKAPGIDFVYVDTYTDDRWCETRLADNLISNGAMIGTENQNDFNRYNSWVHWPEINPNSMHHFVYHTQKDVYGSGSSPIYWGGYARSESFMSWQHRNNITPIVKQFYTNQLPQKYLMCHEVLKDDGTTGYFEGNVTSSNYQIRKDGNLLTDGQGKIFIPWFAEDSETRNPDEAAKIYHWNEEGGDTTWTLPENWSNLSNVYLYKTTQTGKELVDTIEVVDGQVTIHADAQTPYVVYPGEAEPDTTKWSEGSPLEDGSFNSRDFSVWEKSGDADIQFNDDSNGVSILTMEGTEEGAVSQTMEGLVPGQKYRAVVWAGSENGKTARITVETPDGETHTNYVDQIVRGNNCFDTYAQGKRVERVWVDFVQPEGETTAKITFSADACENETGLATFMESRLVKTAEPDLPEGYAANETFEYVEQGGTGIFTPEGGGDGGYHLSHYTEYTNDAININGEWSLKMYGSGSANMRTYPASMRLEPNTEYSMEFDALGYGNVTVESESNSADKPLSDTFEEGHNTYTFVTGDKTDYIVRIADGSNKVLDNFVVKEMIIDKDTLQALVDEAKAIDESAYTSESVKVLTDAIKKAEELLDTDAAAEELKAMYKELKSALDGLVKIVDGYGRIEFENANSYTQETNPDDGHGVSIESADDGKIVGFTFDGAWFQFDGVNFGNVIPKQISVRYTGSTNCYEDARIEIHLGDKDGEIIATVDTPQTGGWNNYTTVTADLDPAQAQKLTGMQSICLVLRGTRASGKTYVGNYNWIEFTPGEERAELSTDVLEYALSLAETADTEGVVDSVVKIFNDAKAAAEDILARVQAGDPSVTQEMVDESWQNLIKAMQYLSFKQGDKTDLQKVIDMAKSLDLNEYLDEGQQAFTDALAAAEAVLANGDAMQDEVDQSWRDLLKAMSELRLKPNKDALKDLIDEANAMSTEGADEEMIAVFENALAAAMSVYDNEQATEEEVATAEEGLQAALDQLRAAVGDTEDPDNSGSDGNTGNGGNSADTSEKDNASAQTDTTKNNSAQKSVKTGDTAAPIAGMAAVMMLAVAAGVIAYRRRRETR